MKSWANMLAGFIAVVLMPWTDIHFGRKLICMDAYEKLNESFAKRVRTLRAEEGYSQEAFAQEAGIDRSYYGRIERGEANPTLRNIAAIAAVFGISVVELFEDLPKNTKKKRVGKS